MARFCTKCGTPLNDKGICPNCPPTVSKQSGFALFVNGIKKQMGIGWDGEDAFNIFERNLQIMPDVIKSNDGEIAVKQYDIALLRSRILQKYAEGRMQVTNKRLLFRASGTSVSGRITIQHEFAINEIAGLEIKKSNRLSGLSLFLGLIVSVIAGCIVEDLFSSFTGIGSALTSIIGYILSAALVIPFFLVKRKFWFKLVCTSLAAGIMSGLSTFSIKGLFLGNSLITLQNILSFVLMIIWLFNLILVAFVPDLKICIKTKSAGDAIQLRRKIWGFGFKNREEYTGFSEVLPWTDTEKATKELGALIDDLQTMGDLAIDKWKE